MTYESDLLNLTIFLRIPFSALNYQDSYNFSLIYLSQILIRNFTQKINTLTEQVRQNMSPYKISSYVSFS